MRAPLTVLPISPPLLDTLVPPFPLEAACMTRIFSFVCGALMLCACAPDDTDAFDTGIAPGAVIIDVRTPEEFTSGHYPGAINIPYDRIVEGLSARSIPHDTALVLYCRSGNRSGRALVTLKAAGFSQLQNAGDLTTLLAVHHQSMSTPTDEGT